IQAHGLCPAYAPFGIELAQEPAIAGVEDRHVVGEIAADEQVIGTRLRIRERDDGEREDQGDSGEHDELLRWIAPDDAWPPVREPSRIVRRTSLFPPFRMEPARPRHAFAQFHTR